MWDGSRWVSDATTIIRGVDVSFVWTTEVDWSYLTDSDDKLGGWGEFMIHDASRIIALGFKMQDRSDGRILDQAGVPGQCAPWYYQWDPEDLVQFANDFSGEQPQIWPFGSGKTVMRPPSGYQRPNGLQVGTTGQALTPNIGRGNPLQSDGSGVAKRYANDWADVEFLLANADGSSSAVPTMPTKQFLYPTIYAKNNSGVRGAGKWRIANYHYQVRFVSP